MPASDGSRLRGRRKLFTNEIYDGYVDPAHSKWWSSMAWENKLYRAGKANGSYDMELFTQSQEQLDAYKAGKASKDNYFTKWGTFSKLPSNWPLLRDNTTHPDGYSMDFATISREYAIATMTNNISLDICEHYGVELFGQAPK